MNDTVYVFTMFVFTRLMGEFLANSSVNSVLEETYCVCCPLPLLPVNSVGIPDHGRIDSMIPAIYQSYYKHQISKGPFTPNR
jgi:hypothetical protein